MLEPDQRLQSSGQFLSCWRRSHDEGGVQRRHARVEYFGAASAPLVLLAGGTTMLSWPDALCEALARGRRHVVRYDLRDCGSSTTVNPTAPAYTLRDLAADAASLGPQAR